MYLKSGFVATHASAFECGCHEVVIVKVTSRFNNFYIFSIYRNPNLDNSIYDCLLSSMASVQEMDQKAAFLSMGDFNAHHRDWLSSLSPTNQYGVAAYDFSCVSGCDQLVDGPTHISGNCLDLVMTDTPGIVTTTINSPIGSSDHNSLSIKLDLNFPIPNIEMSRRILLKSQVNWDHVRDNIASLDWSSIRRSVCPIEALNSSLTDIISRLVPSRIIKSKVKDKSWFNPQCRAAYRDKQNAFRLWSRNRFNLLWENYCRYRNAANIIYRDAQRDYNKHLQEILSGANNPHKWWASLKSSLFGNASAIPPLCRSDGSLSFVPEDKARIFSDFFRSKQCADVVSLPLSCFPEPHLLSLAFRSKEVETLLSDLDPYGGTDPCGMFPLFFNKVSHILAPKLSKIFRILIRKGSFPVCWRTADVTPIPKSANESIYPKDYRPISITPILSKVFERLLAKRIINYFNKFDIISSYQFGFRKGLSTSDALLTMVHDLQLALDRGAEARVVSLDFSSAFDCVNHKALLYKLQLVGIGGRIFNILSNFLSNRHQRVKVDSSFSNFTNVISGVPQGSVLGPLLFILYTTDMWSNVSSKMVAYADDTTIYSIVNSPSDRAAAAESISSDLEHINRWCQLWGMQLNPSKTSCLIVSRSRTASPAHPQLSLNGHILNNCNTIKLLGITFDSKLTFEEHIRKMSSSIAQKIGILRKCRKVYEDDSIVKHSFFSFILPHFEYCAPVWCSAAQSHIRLINRCFSMIRFILPDVELDLDHRRKVGCLSLFYKIFNSPDHPLFGALPNRLVPTRVTRGSEQLNSCAILPFRCCTSQFSRCFLPSMVKVWNILPNDIVLSDNVNVFKSRLNKFLISS